MSNNIGAEVISIRYQVMADEEIEVGGIYTYVGDNGFYTVTHRIIAVEDKKGENFLIMVMCQRHIRKRENLLSL